MTPDPKKFLEWALIAWALGDAHDVIEHVADRDEAEGDLVREHQDLIEEMAEMIRAFAGPAPEETL